MRIYWKRVLIIAGIEMRFPVPQCPELSSNETEKYFAINEWCIESIPIVMAFVTSHQPLSLILTMSFLHTLFL